MMMVGERRRMCRGRIFSLLRNEKDVMEKKGRTIVVGLKSNDSGAEMLVRFIHTVVMLGDYLLAIHVRDSENDMFDPNSFHVHEDLCKSKQVDFEVKVCDGSCYIFELSHQVRISFATILALGCNALWPNRSLIFKYLKELPPTCSLLVMNNIGRIVIELQGTSQQGSTCKKVLQSSPSALINVTNSEGMWETRRPLQKSLTMPSPRTTSSLQWKEIREQGFETSEVSERLSSLGTKCFSLDELGLATDNFRQDFLIGESGKTLVYRANLESGETGAVKVFKSGGESSVMDVFHEVEVLGCLRHENVVRLIGYCCNHEISAIVYDLLEGDLRHKLKYLNWKERIGVAIGVAKALDYLHSQSPPIVHRDVKSSNILLSDNCHPRLSDFGAAIAIQKNQKASPFVKPIPVVGTFGYMAPEYMMYGKVDEKIDVYSYGVVLLELITGREALTTKLSNQESLVLWARSLLSRGLCENLIDPSLNKEYDKDEMRVMMVATRLCLLHSSSRRPTMKRILRLLEEPEHLLELQKREEFLNWIDSKGENTDNIIQVLDSLY